MSDPGRNLVAYDPRVVAEYDYFNPDGPDHDFYRALASEARARHVADLGCGTGILTVTLTGPGRHVVGIDPSPQMLEHAAGRPGGQDVEWLLGTSEMLPDGLDLVIMSGNVAMHILDLWWTTTLRDIRSALVPGGTLAFETRNPAHEAWRSWNGPGSTRSSPFGEVRERVHTTAPDERGIVTMTGRTTYVDSGETIESIQRLRFRDHDRLVRDLTAAGLSLRAVWQDWSRTPYRADPTEPLMIFEAQRPL